MLALFLRPPSLTLNFRCQYLMKRHAFDTLEQRILPKVRDILDQWKLEKNHEEP